MKRTIRLTEGRLRRMIREAVDDYMQDDEEVVSIDKESLPNGETFDWVGLFYHGLALVGLNDKLNLINTEGQLLSDTWFDYVNSFDRNGLALVELNDKYNFINEEGQLVSGNWFDDVVNYYNDDYPTLVELNGRLYRMDTEGNLYNNKTGELIR